MAAQTLVDEKWAGDQKTPITINVKGTGTISYDEVKDLAEVKDGTISDVEITDGKITELTFTHAGKKCVYDPDESPKYAVSADE